MAVYTITFNPASSPTSQILTRAETKQIYSMITGDIKLEVAQIDLNSSSKVLNRHKPIPH